jgi:hypothetical protein
MLEIVKIFAGLVVGTVSIRSITLAYRLWFGDSNAYEQNRLRAGSWRRSAWGSVPTNFDGHGDYRVATGIALNTKTNTWIAQGRLSAVAISSVLKS